MSRRSTFALGLIVAVSVPAPAPRPEYADPELGLRGVGLVLAAAVGAIIALALLVAWRLSA